MKLNCSMYGKPCWGDHYENGECTNVDAVYVISNCFATYNDPHSLEPFNGDSETDRLADKFIDEFESYPGQSRDFADTRQIWHKFPKTKPAHGQICIVAANNIAQSVAVRWCHSDQEFYWYDTDLGIDPYPTEATTHWMSFPADPK